MKSLLSKLKDKRTLNLVFIFTATIYTLSLFRAILFKYVRPWELFAPYRIHYIGVNLIPFNGSGADFIRDIIINIVLFAPFGFLISMKTIDKKKSALFLLIPFAVSIIFEVLQYIFQLGAADVNDVIMNTIGACLGFLFYFATFKLSKNKDKLNFIYSMIMFFVAVVDLALLY